MLITIENEQLRLKLDTLGAEWMSLKTADGVEYLWQGERPFWEGRAPVLFPFVGRLTDSTCSVHGKNYSMKIHGFASASEFTVCQLGTDYVVLQLRSDPETLAQYPFDFTFTIRYALEGMQVKTTYQVENHSGETMPFGIGGHPGFRVPMVSGEQFEDYSLVFTQDCQPDRVGFTPKVFLSGQDTPYPLREGRILDLRHDLFNEDAVVLKNMAREVTLLSRISGRGVRVAYPDMPYVGFWHSTGKQAPFVCIEPWVSLPARQDVVEELTCKSDLVQLQPGDTYVNNWFVTLLKGNGSV